MELCIFTFTSLIWLHDSKFNPTKSLSMFKFGWENLSIRRWIDWRLVFFITEVFYVYYRLDLRKCSPLSTSFSSHQLEAEKREIEDRNIVYREKFPKVREQMESKLLEFIRDEEMVEEELIGGDAVWAFIHKQLIEIARITLKKSEENLITCQVKRLVYKLNVNNHNRYSPIIRNDVNCWRTRVAKKLGGLIMKSYMRCENIFELLPDLLES